jgi:acyl-CoA ligase (AMP-forming) (exosortase A-associated)
LARQPGAEMAIIESTHLHQLIGLSAARTPDATALIHGAERWTYERLAGAVAGFAAAARGAGLRRGDRVAVYLEKRPETVVACFGAAAAGLVFVPLNPLLKAPQVEHILRDSGARLLVTSAARAEGLASDAASPPRVLVDPGAPPPEPHRAWDDFLAKAPSGPLFPDPAGADTDTTAILYTSGSTGKPKGVVLSHRNMVAGAKSVASYLDNRPTDVLLAALPLSFDAGFSQLTTAFHAGAAVVLLNYLLPRDVLKTVTTERVTGITAVPPLWIQLAPLPWPSTVTDHLRYVANTGGRLPLEVLKALRGHFPKTRPYLMYGLTEAFRSTYLDPAEVDRRPDSIGKAIPNAEILVVRPDGTLCDVDEPGELVHRGPLVAQGYWNDPEKTAERFRPLPAGLGGRETGHPLPEIAVFSGDTVRRDADGFLYFIGRRDEMIKTSGYRVSPTEIEEVLYDTLLVEEAAAFGVPHPAWGQAVVAVVKGRAGAAEGALLDACRERLPVYMTPAKIDVRSTALPRNPNGKIDRKTLSQEFAGLFPPAP